MAKTAALFNLPPKLVDLKWDSGIDGVHAAAASKQFWIIWKPENKELLRTCGLTVKLGNGGKYDVIWNSLSAIAGYEARLDGLQAAYAHHIAEQAIQDRRMAEHQAMRDAQYVQWEIQWAAERDAARAKAGDYLTRYGTMVEKPDRELLSAKVSKERLESYDIKQIEGCCRRIDRRVGKFARDAVKLSRQKEPLTWAEDEIIAGARHLTSQDADHSEEPNARGWNRGDSSWGHWACSQFGTEHHAVAVEVCRKILPTYVGTQLRKPGDAA